MSSVNLYALFLTFMGFLSIQETAHGMACVERLSLANRYEVTYKNDRQYQIRPASGAWTSIISADSSLGVAINIVRRFETGRDLTTRDLTAAEAAYLELRPLASRDSVEREYSQRLDDAIESTFHVSLVQMARQVAAQQKQTQQERDASSRRHTEAQSARNADNARRASGLNPYF